MNCSKCGNEIDGIHVVNADGSTVCRDCITGITPHIPRPIPPFLDWGSNIISETYGDEYSFCVNEARKYFREESAIASQTATLYIQYNKDKSSIKGLQERLRQKIEANMPSLMSIYMWHYAPLINKFPKLGQAIRHWFKEMAVIDYKEMDERVKDYMYRNGVEDYNIFCLKAYECALMHCLGAGDDDEETVEDGEEYYDDVDYGDD